MKCTQSLVTNGIPQVCMLLPAADLEPSPPRLCALRRCTAAHSPRKHEEQQRAGDGSTAHLQGEGKGGGERQAGEDHAHAASSQLAAFFNNWSIAFFWVSISVLREGDLGIQGAQRGIEGAQRCGGGL